MTLRYFHNGLVGLVHDDTHGGGDEYLERGYTEYPNARSIPVSSAQKIAVIEREIVEYLDSVAKFRGYDNIKSAKSYALSSAVQSFQAEGQAFADWESLIWEKAYQLFDAYKAGGQEMTAAEVIAVLPVLGV